MNPNSPPNPLPALPLKVRRWVWAPALTPQIHPSILRGDSGGDFPKKEGDHEEEAWT
jgi:hypothetical protein